MRELGQLNGQLSRRSLPCVLFVNCWKFMYIPGPEVIKLFSCSTLMSMNFFLLINVEMPTIVNISIFKSSKNSNIGLSEPEKC